jgi:hypothetical protein
MHRIAGIAQMVKLVDTPASGAGDLTVVEVRVFFWAPYSTETRESGFLRYRTRHLQTADWGFTDSKGVYIVRPTTTNMVIVIAQMVKLVDTPASGAGDLTVVEVRVFFWAPYSTKTRESGFLRFRGWKRVSSENRAAPIATKVGSYAANP